MGGPLIRIPNNWKPRAYQMPLWLALEAGKKKAVAVWHRRAGKDDLCLHWTATAAMEQVGTYWHMLPEASQARKAIWDAVNPHTGKRRIDEAFPLAIRENTRDHDMFIRFTTGSTWQVIGSDNYESLLGTPPRGLVFSEYAQANPNAWAMLRPILAENNGWALFISCVTASTLILLPTGMVTMGELLGALPDGYTDCDQQVYGIGGYHRAEQAYRAQKQRTLKIKTSKGYEIECTPIHPLWTGAEWRKSSDWRIGESLPIQLDQQCFPAASPAVTCALPSHGHNKPLPFDLESDDFYYFLGLVISEGSWNEHVVTISNTDAEIIEFLARHGFKCTDGVHNTTCNQALVTVIDWLGIKRGAKNKGFPKSIRALSEAHQRAVLQGYFDGDGCATKRGGVHCDSVSHELIRVLQVMLLNFGIVSSRREYVAPPSERVKVSSHGSRLEIGGHMAGRFFDRIGFRLTRKQARKALLTDRQRAQRQDQFTFNPDALPEGYWDGTGSGDLRRQGARGVLSYCTIKQLHSKKPLPLWERILEDGYHYDHIISVEESEAEVFDFVIPETHSFFSNGMISHNTPRGRNHLHRLYEFAKSDPEWFAQILTVTDTGAIPAERIEQERRELIAERGSIEEAEAIIQQEYMCSWQASLPGTYYATIMAHLDEQGSIDRYPYNPQKRVGTAWDLGIGDSTAIWFYQELGSSIVFIDCLEGSGVGLDWYAKQLAARPYAYYDHILPHDAGVHDLGTGLTRVRTLADLGIRGRVMDRGTGTAGTGIDDGIQAVRSLLPRCLFNTQPVCVLGESKEQAKERMGRGLDALRNYRRIWDDKLRRFRDAPHHDYCSHYADAMRYCAQGYRSPTNDADFTRIPANWRA